MEINEKVLDDRGTTQSDAQEILRLLLSREFGGDIPLLAQALGRPTCEIEAVINYDENVDEDLLMKVKGLAQDRNVDIIEK